MCRRGTAHNQTEDRDKSHCTLPRYRHVMGCSRQDPNALLARSAACRGTAADQQSLTLQTTSVMSSSSAMASASSTASCGCSLTTGVASAQQKSTTNGISRSRAIVCFGSPSPQSIGSDVANQHLSFLVRRLRDRPSPFRRVSMAHGKRPFRPEKEAWCTIAGRPSCDARAGPLSGDLSSLNQCFPPTRKGQAIM